MFKKNSDSSDSIKQYFGDKLYFGPFAGLKIPDQVYKKLSVSEKLGMYESCLHPKFSELLNRNIRNIIVVGGNNGYYSAGLSYLFNPDQLTVYETISTLHPYILSWFDANQLPACNISGEATIAEFKKWDDKIDLVFMDCEGYEIHLLNPESFRWQADADVLVELHPFYVENLIGSIVRRFENTHTAEIIYDDFTEDDKIQKILEVLPSKITYNKHPGHRWINQNGQKIYTGGIFLFLKRKKP
jgi:hypothetical protein